MVFQQGRDLIRDVSWKDEAGTGYEDYVKGNGEEETRWKAVLVGN